jgi:hypothetical protein
VPPGHARAAALAAVLPAVTPDTSADDDDFGDDDTDDDAGGTEISRAGYGADEVAGGTAAYRPE